MKDLTGVARTGGEVVTEDQVVSEVRATREAFAAAHGYDIRAMVDALREQGLASGRELIRLDPRPANGAEQVSAPSQASQQTAGACGRFEGSSQ